MTAQQRRQCPGEKFVVAGIVAGKHRARLGVANRREHPAKLGSDDVAAQQQGQDQNQPGNRKQRHASAGMSQGKSHDPFEVGKAVIAAKSRVVTKKQQHERKGQRLGDDREIDAFDARAKGKPAETQTPTNRAPAGFSIAPSENIRCRPSTRETLSSREKP